MYAVAEGRLIKAGFPEGVKMRYNGVWAHEIVHGMFSMASRGRGAPRTSRPTMGARVRVRTWRALADMARGVVGADVPGGPRARGRPRGPRHLVASPSCVRTADLIYFLPNTHVPWCRGRPGFFDILSNK